MYVSQFRQELKVGRFSVTDIKKADPCTILEPVFGKKSIAENRVLVTSNILKIHIIIQILLILKNIF